MCKKLLSLLLSLTILLGAVWVPAAADGAQTVYIFLCNGSAANVIRKIENAVVGMPYAEYLANYTPTEPTGYEFKGWSSSANGTEGDLLDLSTDISDTKRNIFLYTVFTPKTISVTYILNNGEEDQVIDSTYGQPYTFPADPTRTNYTFDGWYKSASGSSGKIVSTTKVTDEKSHTIYAHWTQLKRKVTLDYNGGKLGNSSAGNTVIEVPYGNTYANVLSSYTPRQDGYSFAGWLDGSADFDTSTTAGENSPIKLTAKWVPATYTVTLDPNCSDSLTGFETKSFHIQKDQTYAQVGAAALGQKPGRTGYEFKGWFTASNSGGQQIGSTTDTVYGKTTNQTLYARWEANKYKLTYDYAFPQGAAWKDQTGTVAQKQPDNPADGVATYNSTYPALPVPAAKDIPYYDAGSTKKYTFAGWYDIDKDVVNSSDPTDPGTNKIGRKITGGTNGNTYQIAKGQELYARWGYEIEFFANDSGNAATESACGKLSCVTGAAYNISAMPEEPSRAGYKFAGWYQSANQSSADKFEPTASNIADGSIKKLYAHWTPDTYTVTLDPNGGEISVNTKDVAFDNTYPVLPQPASRKGYAFSGWFTEKDGGTKVTTETTVTRTEDHTLYAQWTPLELTLNFKYNFPDGIDQDEDHPDIDPTTAIYGAEYGTALPVTDPLPVSSEEITYTFAGWYTTAKDSNAGASGTGEVTGQRMWSSSPVELAYTGTPASATLYARWRYSIDFYANVDPEADDESPIDSINAVCGSRYGTLPGQPDSNPSRYFLGWFADREGTQEVKETDIADGTTVKLYAKWGGIRTCTVTISGNGAALPDGYPTSDLIEYGQYLSKLFNQVSDPTRDGYTFDGWYLDAECTGSAVTSDYIVEEDFTIYAKWVINSFTVTFILNYPDSDDIVKSADYGTLLSAVLPTPTPERTGYAFDGWYTDEYCETPADTAAEVTADITLYAKWIEATRIYLVVGGGTLPEGTPDHINVYEDGTYRMLPEPTWLGCTFLGWYTQPEGGVKVNRSDTVPAASSIPTTLYAQWSAMDITVNFHPNGSSNSSRSSIYKVGSTYGGNGSGLPILGWTGHEFMGWYTQSVGGSKVDSSTVVSVTSNDVKEITLFAHWGYKVTFDPNTGNGTMETKIVEMNQPYTMPECTFTPPAGKSFNGWAIGSANAADVYPSGSQYTVSRHTILYATWVTSPLVITATYTSGGTLLTEDGMTGEVVVERGRNITFVTSPLPGYVLKALVVDGENYNYTDKHTFKNVTANHTVHAVFERIGPPAYLTCDHGPSCPMNKYRDLDVNRWYHDGVHYCLDNVIMSGTSPTAFNPGARTTRAQVATCLYNYASRPSISGNGPLPRTYSDVMAGSWFYQPVEWATKMGYLYGYGNGKFGPNDPITREQLVAILWRHAGRPQPRYSTLRNFYDASQVSNYAWTAMCWATEQGILSGRSVGHLVPKGYATRAEVAKMLKNYFELL